MSEELGEKTEQPTSRKLSNARNQGQVTKSVELSAALDMIGSVIVLVLLGPMFIHGCSTLMRNGMSPDRFSPQDAIGVRSQILWAFGSGTLLLMPVLMSMFFITAIAQFVQVGWLWTSKPIMPKWNRISPASGIKRLFSRRNFIKTIVSCAKLCIILAIAYTVVSGKIRILAFLPALSGIAALSEIGTIVFDLIVWLLSLLLVLGLADYLYQRWQHRQDLRMTKQEVKEERRSMEGDEQTKARRIRLARSMLLQQMQQGVKTADVIVTNPTHFAVAVRYDSEHMQAPRVVAKGADFMAFRIREMANLYGVPIVEKPPLARALYADIDVGRSVTPEFYQAIAEILSYVYRLKRRAA